MSRYSPSSATYATHIYAYDKYGSLITRKATNVTLYNRAKLTTPKISLMDKGYNIMCYLPTRTTNVRCVTQAIDAGRYGVRDNSFNVMSYTGGYWSINIEKANFFNVGGSYSNDIYAYDSKGKLIDCYYSANIKLD